MKIFIVLSVFFFSTSITAEEWSYNDKKNENSIRLNVSTCYDDPTKFYINFENTIEGLNYSSKSVSATCNCGDQLVLNDSVTISSSSFADVVKAGIPFVINNYQCVAPK